MDTAPSQWLKVIHPGSPFSFQSLAAVLTSVTGISFLHTLTHSLSSPALFGVIDPITHSLPPPQSGALLTAQLILYAPQTLTEAESGPKRLPTFPRTTFCAAHELFIPTIQKKHSGNTWTLTLPSYITFCCTWVTPLHSSYFISGLTPIFLVFLSFFFFF